MRSRNWLHEQEEEGTKMPLTCTIKMIKFRKIAYLCSAKWERLYVLEIG